MKFDFLTLIKGAFILILIGIPMAITYDVLFSKPIVMSGVIVDKIHVPGSEESRQSIMPYTRYKSYDYIVTAQKEEQWIAFVKTSDNKILKVNCHIHHYEQTQVGDTLKFKEYTGEIFHIDYFTHNEEDEELSI